MGPYFTIIIPTYNSDKTFTTCVESVLTQSYKNFEILIIDGLSSDNTVKLAKKFAAKHENIRWVSEKDKGTYDAMNKGIKMAKGDWLYFLGSDDTLFSMDILTKLLPELNGFDIIYGNVLRKCFTDPYDGEFTKGKLFERNICHQAILYNKRVFKVIGNFNIRFKYHADWDHNFRWFFSRKIRKRYIPVIIANFSEGGLSSTRREIFFSGIRKWKYFVLTKNEIRLRDKIKIMRQELHNALYENRRRDALLILFQIPFFLF